MPSTEEDRQGLWFPEDFILIGQRDSKQDNFRQWQTVKDIKQQRAGD